MQTQKDSEAREVTETSSGRSQPRICSVGSRLKTN